MGLFLSDATPDVVVVGTSALSLRVADAVARLGFRPRRVPAEVVSARTLRAGCHVIESDALRVLGRMPLPSVVITHGAPIPDRALAVVRGPGVSVLGMPSDPTTLLAAMLEAELGLSPQELARLVPGLPNELVAAFLRRRGGLRSLRDLCVALGVTPKHCRRLLHVWGFQRPQHLFAHLRREFERLLSDKVSPAYLRLHLGIRRRDNFHRSCRRLDEAVHATSEGGSDT